MPVYVPSIKRARRRRKRLDSDEEQSRVDTLSFVCACDKAAGKLKERNTVTTEQRDPISPTNYVKRTKVTFMEDPVDSQHLPLSHNDPSINQSENASPNRNRDHVQQGIEKSFKRRRSFSSRKRDVEEIVKKHPHKVPIIIERAQNEKILGLLDKSKFLVPEELTMSQLTTIISRRLQLGPAQTFFLIVNRRSMASSSMTLAEVYSSHKDPDGFLYIVYASQDAFG